MYVINYRQRVVKRDIPALSPQAAVMIRSAIESKLMQDPIAFGKPLRHGLYGQRRLRVGNYRVVYTVDVTKKEVMIEAIGHRRHIYD